MIRLLVVSLLLAVASTEKLSKNSKSSRESESVEIFSPKCPRVARSSCCSAKWSGECVPRHCFRWVAKNCPERMRTVLSRKIIRIGNKQRGKNIRRAPTKRTDLLSKCGTAERNYEPCTSKTIANRLFQQCCHLYVPEECHSLCQYETDQMKTRQMLVEMVDQKKCGMRYLSSILYCASQNRDNRQCCADLDLNAPQLQVGSRCLRMCDPSGTAIERITKEDVTCLYNWNVIMYCHHSGIREM